MMQPNRGRDCTVTPTERDVDAHLPLTPLSFQILLALVDEERHGYGIMKEIERRTKGRMSPATGPLYLAAQRLLDTGLIEESSKRPAPELDDRRRKYYRLTPFGRRVAAAEAERMAYLVGVAFDKRLLEGELTISGGDIEAASGGE
jgi:DNA-binding PadR family transcriptional regulator